MKKTIFFEPGLKPVIKFNPNHDEKGQFSSGPGGAGSAVADLQNFDPTAPISESPKNAGGMTAKAWEAWEHGPDGQNFIELFRKYAAQELGLDVPQTPFDQGGYLHYMMDRGWGAPNRNEAIGMLNAIANGKPQPALYRGMTGTNDPESNALLDKFTAMKPGETFDMPLVSTTRSLGVASWYAADMVKNNPKSVIVKIQPGAKGVALKADNSWYPQDHEVITSGKFKVVSVDKVSAPYWKRSVFEPRKTEFSYESKPYYEIATYDGTKFTPEYAKKAYDAVTSGNWKSLETPTIKFTQDRRGGGLSMWTLQPPKDFTVVEVQMVEPHVVQKGVKKDNANDFFHLFNNIPFIDDSLEAVNKFNPNHDDRGRFSSGSGMGAGVAQSILDRVKENGGLSVNMVDGSEPTSGYMVAKGTQYGATVSAADFYDPIKGPKILADYMKKNKSDLGTGKNYLGLWHNTENGNVYLDVSQNIQDKGEAISAGQARDQISIWDVANFAEIQTGGTGVTKQEIGSGGIADEHFGDDGFGNRSLRSEDLGEVSKTQVIRFEPGLKPIIKFNPYHDERGRFTTGTGYAQGGYTAEQTYRQNQMKGKGPTTAALDSFLAVMNDNTTGDTYDQRQAAKEEMKTKMNEVYGMTVNGLTSKVTSVRLSGEKTIWIHGDITDKYGAFVGQFDREMTRQAGGFIVEHKLLKLSEEARGKGFGKKFIPLSEAYYINNGFKRIDVFTGWDGARHWARAGYDWNPGKRAMRSTFEHLATWGAARGFTDNTTPDGRKFNKLMSQVSPNWAVNPFTNKGGWTNADITFHPRNDSFPIPNDFATIGYKKGATSWGGKTLLASLNLYYSKPLTPAGMNIKNK